MQAVSGRAVLVVVLVGLFVGKNPGVAGAWSLDTDLGTADASFQGESSNDYAGYAVAAAGDVNGDGYDDMLIGARGNGEAASSAGQVYLFFGAAAGFGIDTGLADADASFLGEGANDFAGISVAAAGDVNGDGYDDILIGAFGNAENGTNAGQVYLIFGAASGWAMDTSLATADASFLGEAAGDYAGISVDGVGDVNADGYDDILIGAHWNDEAGPDAGQAYLFYGTASGWAMDTSLANADASFLAEAAGDRAGGSVVGVGDVDGDGYDDFLIAAYWYDDGYNNEAGQAYLFYGDPACWTMDTDLGTADASFLGEDWYNTAGGYMGAAGDVNGDGYDDFLIGAYANDDGGYDAGQAYLWFGSPARLGMGMDLGLADASFVGEATLDYAGTAVTGIGDVNGDGFDDILVGGPWNDEAGSDAGQVYLYYGGVTGLAMDMDLGAADASFQGEAASNYAGHGAGRGVAGVGDVNADGAPDFLIGAYGNGDNGSWAGKAYLWYGASACADADADGYLAEHCEGLDCDDADANTYPGAPEVYDAADNDCDGLYDEGLLPAEAVIITEVMVQPQAVPDVFGEWIEVANDAPLTVNLIGMEFYDAAGDSFTVTTDLWIESGDQVVLGVSADVLANGGADVDFEYDPADFALDDASDEVFVDQDGVFLDGVEYDQTLDWPDHAGSSMSLDAGSYDVVLNDDVDSWCSTRLQNAYRLGMGDYATPGDSNDDCAAVYGDLFMRVIEPVDTVRAPGEAVGTGRTLMRNLSGTELSLTLTGRLSKIGGGPSYVPVSFTGVTLGVGGVTARPIVFLTPPGFPLGDYRFLMTVRDEDTGAMLGTDTFTLELAIPESCNGVDDDGDGMIDEGFDEDRDGWTTCDGDCDDTDADVNPGAYDYCGDGIDQDCDGVDASCP